MQKLEIEYFMNFGIRYFDFSANANKHWTVVESDVLNALGLEELSRKTVPLAKGAYTLIREYDVYAAFLQSEAPCVKAFKAWVNSLPSRFRISKFVWDYMLPDIHFEIIRAVRIATGISDTRLFSMLLPGKIKDMSNCISELNKQNITILHTQVHLIANNVFHCLYNAPGYYHILERKPYRYYAEIALGVMNLIALGERLGIYLPIGDIMVHACNVLR